MGRGLELVVEVVAPALLGDAVVGGGVAGLLVELLATLSDGLAVVSSVVVVDVQPATAKTATSMLARTGSPRCFDLTLTSLG